MPARQDQAPARTPVAAPHVTPGGPAPSGLKSSLERQADQPERPVSTAFNPAAQLGKLKKVAPPHEAGPALPTRAEMNASRPPPPVPGRDASPQHDRPAPVGASAAVSPAPRKQPPVPKGPTPLPPKPEPSGAAPLPKLPDRGTAPGRPAPPVPGAMTASAQKPPAPAVAPSTVPPVPGYPAPTIPVKPLPSPLTSAKPPATPLSPKNPPPVVPASPVAAPAAAPAAAASAAPQMNHAVISPPAPRPPPPPKPKAAPASTPGLPALEELVSHADPTQIYTDFNVIGAGASGSVYTAKVAYIRSHIRHSARSYHCITVQLLVRLIMLMSLARRTRAPASWWP